MNLEKFKSEWDFEVYNIADTWHARALSKLDGEINLKVEHPELDKALKALKALVEEE